MRLAVGIVATVYLLAGALETGIERFPVQFSAGFSGLVLAASVLAAKRLEQPTQRHAIVGVVAAVITFVALGFKVSQVTNPSLGIFFLAGMVAICAMILPGVSGSFLLLAIGMYQPVIAAVSDRDIAVVAAVGAGAIAGLVVFSNLLDAALERAHDAILAALIGLMVGSIRVLWPWPAGEGVGDPTLGAPDELVLISSIIFVAAFVAVVALDALAHRLAGESALADAERS